MSSCDLPGAFFSLCLNKKASPDFIGKGFVPRTGFEPAHPCERCDLNTVRLPISPPGQKKKIESGKLKIENEQLKAINSFSFFYYPFSVSLFRAANIGKDPKKETGILKNDQNTQDFVPIRFTCRFSPMIVAKSGSDKPLSSISFSLNPASRSKLI